MTATPQRRCVECGTIFDPTGESGTKAIFCSGAHRTAFQARQRMQGRAIISLAKAWRVSRNRSEDKEIGRQALSEMCAILDQFIAEDRDAGRPRPTVYADIIMNRGYRFIDRRRRAA